MRKIFLVIALMFTSALVVIHDADAKRMGGGKSFGRQSQQVDRAPAQRQATPPAQQQSAAAPASAPAKPASPWKGILGGALAGLGIAALFSALGFSGALSNIMGTLLIVIVVVALIAFAMRFFRSKKENYAGAGANGMSPAFQREAPMQRTPDIGSGLASAAPAAATHAGRWGVPADFDTQGFLRQAKTYFLRLQAAWDKADLNDLREFTTPEMFAEVRLELQERGASANVTDVMVLDAELLGIEASATDYLASVRFSGRIRESEAQPAENFVEVWNLTKPVSGGGWLLAGIQQVAG